MRRTSVTGTVRYLPLLFAVATIAAGCGAASPSQARDPNLLRLDGVGGWKQVWAEPGIGELAPDLGGLDLTARADAPTLVRRGDAVRATKLVFAKPADAAQAFARTRPVSFEPLLFEQLHGRIRRLASPVGYRITVTRPAEPGQDTVELFAIRRGRSLILVELLSARGFRPTLRDRILAGVSR